MATDSVAGVGNSLGVPCSSIWHLLEMVFTQPNENTKYVVSKNSMVSLQAFLAITKTGPALVTSLMNPLSSEHLALPRCSVPGVSTQPTSDPVSVSVSLSLSLSLLHPPQK